MTQDRRPSPAGSVAASPWAGRFVRDADAHLFDEPLSNLDAKLRLLMRSEISRLHRGLGLTAVYVTHDQIEAMTLGDRVAVLHKGTLQQVDSPRQIYERAEQHVRRQLHRLATDEPDPGDDRGATLQLPIARGSPCRHHVASTGSPGTTW